MTPVLHVSRLVTVVSRMWTRTTFSKTTKTIFSGQSRASQVQMENFLCFQSRAKMFATINAGRVPRQVWPRYQCNWGERINGEDVVCAVNVVWMLGKIAYQHLFEAPHDVQMFSVFKDAVCPLAKRRRSYLKVMHTHTSCVFVFPGFSCPVQTTCPSSRTPSE